METRIRHRSMGKLIAAAAVGFAGLHVSQARAAAIVDGVLIDVRATQLNGVPVVDPKHVEAFPGDVVTFQLFAIVTGTNGLDDEGFHTIHGAIRSSSGGLLGDIAAQPVAPFDGTGSSTGTTIDVDSDGDLDVSGPNPNLSSGYFVARNAAGFSTDGMRSGADSEEFLIGVATFTVTGGPSIADTVVNYVQHRTTSGGNNLAWGTFLLDGNNNGTSPRNPTNTWVEGSGVFITNLIPEPSGLALVGIGALGLLARRKKNA